MLKKINLKNFRNYINTEVVFKDGLNVLLGSNAAGKTNLLEAINFIATLKSFRGIKLSDLVFYEKQAAKIELEANENLFTASWQTENRKRDLQLNGRKAKTIDFLENLQTVLFTPDDLMLIGGEPSLRRKFLDSLLVRLEPRFISTLNRYRLSVRNRNALLALRSNSSQFDFWEDKIATDGSLIWQKRSEIVEKINQNLKISASDFSPSEGLSFVMDFPNEARDKETFLQTLRNKRRSDMERGATSLGPHRDDWEMQLESQNLRLFGSRGEQRTAVVALKFSEAALLTELKNKKPILLLDDIFSELDQDRSEALRKFINKYQTVLTCTDFLDGIDANIFKVENGKIEQR